MLPFLPAYQRLVRKCVFQPAHQKSTLAVKTFAYTTLVLLSGMQARTLASSRTQAKSSAFRAPVAGATVVSPPGL